MTFGGSVLKTLLPIVIKQHQKPEIAWTGAARLAQRFPAMAGEGVPQMGSSGCRLPATHTHMHEHNTHMCAPCAHNTAWPRRILLWPKLNLKTIPCRWYDVEHFRLWTLTSWLWILTTPIIMWFLGKFKKEILWALVFSLIKMRIITVYAS